MTMQIIFHRIAIRRPLIWMRKSIARILTAGLSAIAGTGLLFANGCFTTPAKEEVLFAPTPMYGNVPVAIIQNYPKQNVHGEFQNENFFSQEVKENRSCRDCWSFCHL